ncbi:hypothetical protein BFJ69_g3708 [Fusarium oxysporum]|uniref:Major facilitator superfamily (MFS) profile domain-containing protein n=1 Tax=Fusarium oxysporum TaxID=5507 RepID=A0A420NMD1_FUSOX|nr:hypothetical protein BFJ69_g3708 [Fusarium oxysporum]
MFSGVPLYLSFFYPRDKVGFRQGIFLSGSALANVYGGVLGYAILGVRGSVAPWRCLFLIEGLPLWIVAILAWFYLPDDLLSAKFLTDREKEVAWQCVGRGQTVDSQGAGGVSWAEWRSAFLDWRSYVPGLVYFSYNVCFGSLPLFIPTIISEMGYCLLGVSEGVAARYAGVFLSVQIFVSISILLPWVSSVHHTESKRAGGWAIFATLGQFGPLVGTNIFPKDQGPYYHKGAWISCGFTSLVVLLSITYSLLHRWENKRLDRVMIEDAGVGVGMEGDDHPRGFRRQKLRCDLYQHPGQPCSRCKRMHIECNNIVEAPEATVDASPARSDRTAVGTSSSALIYTAAEPSLEVDPSYAVQSDRSSSLSEILGREDIAVKQIDDCFARFFNHYSKLLPGIFNENEVNCESTSLCDGLPYLSISESKPHQRKTRLEEIVDASFHYRIKCHDILIDATRAFGDIIDEQGEGSKSLLPLIRIFSEQVEIVPLPLRDDLCYLTRCCTRLAISAYYFFLQSHDFKRPGLITTFSIATEVLDAVSRLDAMQDFALYASNYYTRMALLAAFCILRLVRSQLKEHIDLRDAQQSLFKAISFVKRRSMQHGDLDERTAPESVQTGATDASTYWNSTAAPVGDSFGSSNFPEVYMDWNFPLDLDYLG